MAESSTAPSKFFQLVSAGALQHANKLRATIPHLKEWERPSKLTDIEHVMTVPGRLLKVLQFCQTAQLKIAKPKVLRSQGAYENKVYRHKGRCIKLMLVLSDKSTSFSLPDPGWLFPTNGLLPALTVKFEVYQQHYRDFMSKEIAEAFYEEAGANFTQIRAQVRAHMEEVEQSLDSIVSAHLSKIGNAEKKAFQRKLADFLGAEAHTIELEPEVLMTLMNTRAEALEAVAGFMKRNKADVALVDLEDVTEASNMAKAKSVMES